MVTVWAAGPALRVLSRFRSYVRPTSHRRRATSSIEEPVWVGGDWFIHSSDTSSSVIRFMSTLISYQKAYFTKGTSFPGNLAVPGNRPHRPGNLRHRRFPQPTLYSFFLSEGLAVHYTKGFQWTIEAIERVPNADGDEGYRLSVDAEPTSSVEQRNESKVTEAFANFDRHSIASK